METAGFYLTLPGKTLYLTPLLAQKKFRKKENKDGAVRALYQLQEEGLGKVLELAGTKGTSSVCLLDYACMPLHKKVFRGDPNTEDILVFKK